MNLEQRFLKYISYDTQSSENATSYPSTSKQLILADVLVEELQSLGVSDAHRSPYGVVYAHIPANTTQPADTIGFIAHMDTSPEASGAHVKPQIIRDYQGSVIILNEAKNMVLDPDISTDLKRLHHHDLITTDGSTLLGADDKAGVAIIMTMVDYLMTHDDFKHGNVAIAFTPDEEIGKGTEHFDVAAFGADYAYTVDGSDLEEYNYETFNAYACVVKITGKSYHPGDAKGKMINAMTLARQFDTMLGDISRPEHTQDAEGFYHLCSINGTISECQMSYIIREHDREKLHTLIARMKAVASYLNNDYHDELIKLTLKEQYKNMKEIISQHPDIVDQIVKAMETIGITPRPVAVRGGTDGALLSYMGVPCPNLGTGGYNFHGPYEYVSLTSMHKAVLLLRQILSENLIRRSEQH